MFWSRSARAALVGVLAAAPVSAFAQDTISIGVAREPNEFERRSSGSLSFIQTRPIGAFQQVGFGYGANLSYQFRLDNAGALSLRADGVLSIYGGEHFYAPLSNTVGGRIQVKVSTNNHVMPLSIGPQLTVPRGWIRPYVNAGIGGQLLFTQSSVEGTDNDYDEFASTTNQSDWTSLWTTGGGVYIPVYAGKSTVMLDFGVQYYSGGRAQYLKPGSIEDLPNGQIRINPLESDTHMYVMRLGVRIGR